MTYYLYACISFVLNHPCRNLPFLHISGRYNFCEKVASSFEGKLVLDKYKKSMIGCNVFIDGEYLGETMPNYDKVFNTK